MSDEERKIAEKVLFWEEQQEINDIIANSLLKINSEIQYQKIHNENNKGELSDIRSSLEAIKLKLGNFTQISEASASKKKTKLSNEGLTLLSIIAIIISIISLIMNFVI